VLSGLGLQEDLCFYRSLVDTERGREGMREGGREGGKEGVYE